MHQICFGLRLKKHLGGSRMSDTIKKIDLSEFVDFGYLQELNRQFLHPLGLALEVNVDDDGKVISLGGVWDYRNDDEGMAFGDLSLESSEEKAVNVKKEQERLAELRKEKLGFVIQPIGHKFEEEE